MENKVIMDQISFLELREIDFNLLYKWYNTDFVNEWYGKEKQEWTYKEIENKYIPYIQGQKPTDSYLISHNDIKIGYIQTYLLKNYPEYNEVVKADDDTYVKYGLNWYKIHPKWIV